MDVNFDEKVVLHKFVYFFVFSHFFSILTKEIFFTFWVDVHYIPPKDKKKIIKILITNYWRRKNTNDEAIILEINFLREEFNKIDFFFLKKNNRYGIFVSHFQKNFYSYLHWRHFLYSLFLLSSLPRQKWAHNHRQPSSPPQTPNPPNLQQRRCKQLALATVMPIGFLVNWVFIIHGGAGKEWEIDGETRVIIRD